MEIVIKIPEEIYDFVQNTSFVEDERTLFKQSNAERQKTLVLFDIIDAIRTGEPLPKCNECKYYEGVHKVQGHAPCSYHTIGGVMRDWYCSQFEADKGSESK